VDYTYSSKRKALMMNNDVVWVWRRFKGCFGIIFWMDCVEGTNTGPERIEPKRLPMSVVLCLRRF
jgi:hypothetical protein